MDAAGQIVRAVSRGFELAGVLALLIGTVNALGSYGVSRSRGRPGDQAYRGLRGGLGRAILLGLEFLVAADIIRSVALAPSLVAIISLGLLVLVRTFLSWALEVELEGQWPWERSRRPPTGDTPAS